MGVMKLKNIIYPITLFLLIFIVFLACGKQKAEWRGTTEVMDGVTVVKNPKEPMYHEEVLSLEEELSLGEPEGQEEYMFSLPTSIAVDDEENIYVLDSKEVHIKVFDNKGIHQKTIGRRGQGPGELQGPLGIQITAKDELWVNNLTSSRIVYFSLEGDFLREAHLTGLPRSRLIMDSSGNFICSYPKWTQPFKVVLEKYNSEQEMLFSIIEIEPDIEKDYSPLAKGILFNVTKEDDIVWAITDKYEIMITDEEGKLSRKIVKSYDSIEISEEEKQNFQRQSTLSAGVEIPKYFPPLLATNIAVDEERRIFIGTYEKGKDGMSYYFDVFDAEGRYVTKVPLRHKLLTPIVWKNKKLYTIEEDRDGYQYVKRYKVTWMY
jgi:hypothetical protein